MASKVSSDVHSVDTMVGHLAEGRFKIGAGDTAVMLEGMITPGKPLPGIRRVGERRAQGVEPELLASGRAGSMPPGACCGRGLDVDRGTGGPLAKS